MTKSKLKILLYLTIGLIVMICSPAVGIFPGAETHAMGFLGSKPGNDQSSGRRVVYSSPQSNPVDLHSEPAPPTPVPEPATLLLVGGGVAGLAALKRKFRKK
jgi:PEP-CTERM motif